MEEPKNIYDLKLMQDTSEGWFEGRISYEAVNPMDCSVGDIHSRTICVSIYSKNDDIAVNCRSLVCDGVSSPACKQFHSELEWCERYSFDEFKESDYWDMTMKAWKGGATDSSHLRDITADADDFGAFVTLNVQTTYTDFLGNKRVGKDYKQVQIDTFNTGELYIKYGSEMWEGTYDELFETLKYARMCKRSGMKCFDDGEIRIKPQEHDDV